MPIWMLDFQIWFKSIVGLLAIPIPAKTGLRASNIGVNDGIDHYFKYFIFKFICKSHHWFIPKGSYKCLCKNPLANFGYNCETGGWYLYGAFLNFLNVTVFLKIAWFTDINQNALTFRNAASFVEANATSFPQAWNLGLGGFFKEDILINIRTFDSTSIIFYVFFKCLF